MAAAIFVNQMRPFTGTVDELYQIIYAKENRIRILEGQDPKSDSDWIELNKLKSEINYLYEQQKKYPYTVSFGTCGVGVNNPDAINFPDYEESLSLNETEAKKEAAEQFKMNIHNLFYGYVYSSTMGKVNVYSLPMDKYQYYWNLFMQRNLPNPDAVNIVYPVKTLDAVYQIPSNPDAYKPDDSGLTYQELMKISDATEISNVPPVINPYVDPDTYIYKGYPEDKPGVKPDTIYTDNPKDTTQPSGNENKGGGVKTLSEPGANINIMGLEIKPLYLAIAGVALIFLLTRKTQKS